MRTLDNNHTKAENQKTVNRTKTENRADGESDDTMEGTRRRLLPEPEPIDTHKLNLRRFAKALLQMCKDVEQKERHEKVTALQEHHVC